MEWFYYVMLFSIVINLGQTESLQSIVKLIETQIFKTDYKCMVVVVDKIISYGNSIENGTDFRQPT